MIISQQPRRQQAAPAAPTTPPCLPSGIPSCCVIKPNALPPELVCTFCHDMVDEPVITPCHHVFCMACMASYRLSNPTKPCPHDRQPLPPTIPSLKASNPALHRLWGGIDLRCPYAALLNCVWSGCGEDYRAHAAACKVRAEAASQPGAAKKVADLQALIRSLEGEMAGLRVSLADLAPLNNLRASVSRLTAEAATLQAKCARQASHNEALSEQVEALREELGTSRVDVDRSYRYDKFRVVELARLILQHLEEAPDLVPNRIFICIRNIHNEHMRGCEDNPENLYLDLRVLLAAALACNWFTAKQDGLMQDMLWKLDQ